MGLRNLSVTQFVTNFLFLSALGQDDLPLEHGGLRQTGQAHPPTCVVESLPGWLKGWVQAVARRCPHVARGLVLVLPRTSYL